MFFGAEQQGIKALEPNADKLVCFDMQMVPLVLTSVSTHSYLTSDADMRSVISLCNRRTADQKQSVCMPKCIIDDASLYMCLQFN